MYTAIIGRKRLLTAMENLKDNASCLYDGEHKNFWLSNINMRIRIPILKEIGSMRDKVFHLYGIVPLLKPLTRDDIRLSFARHGVRKLWCEETLPAEWEIEKPHRRLLFNDHVPISDEYILPTLYFDIMCGLKCEDGVLDICSVPAVEGGQLNHFFKYNTKFPDFKLSQYAIDVMRRFGETTVRMTMCENKHILFKGNYFYFYALNQL